MEKITKSSKEQNLLRKFPSFYSIIIIMSFLLIPIEVIGNTPDLETKRDYSLFEALLYGFGKTLLITFIFLVLLKVIRSVVEIIKKKYNNPKENIKSNNSYEKITNITSKVFNKVFTFFKTIDQNEIIIISIIFGVIVGLVFGYSFGYYKYYFADGTRSFSGKWTYAQFYFHYISAVSSFIISIGIIYIVLKKINMKKE